MEKDFETQLAGFMIGAQEIINGYWQQRTAAYGVAYGSLNCAPAVLSIERGSRYIRVVRADANGTSRSVHCFIDTTNGNVLKAAGWKAPEKKNPRSNIFDADFGMSGMTEYGTKYLR